MSRHCILTEKEFQLMMASVRSERIPDMEELRLTRETKFDQNVCNALVEKQLLLPRDNGRLGVERKAGYIFSGLAHGEARVRGDILYPDGSTARLNLYLLDDAFEAVLWRDSNSIECTWMSNYPLAMGSILHCLNHPEKGMPNDQQLQDDKLLRELLEHAKKEVSGGVKAVFAFTDKLAAEQRKTYFYIAAQDGRFYSTEPEQSGSSLVCQPLHELVRELFQNILTAHQSRIAEVSHEQD